VELVKWRTIDPAGVEEEGATNTTIRVLLGPDLDVPNFVMRFFEIGLGGQTPFHEHPWEHEMFVVSGRGVCVLEDREVPLEPQDAVFMPGGEKHCFRNTGDETLRVICLVPATR
jgi:mannose-6-phosphate isomerase-like protein (cupin superfamily)